MHVNPAQFIEDISPLLGFYYITMAAMNAILVWYLWQRRGWGASAFAYMIVVVGGFVAVAATSMGGSPPAMPHGFMDFVNVNTGPVVYSVGTTTLLVLMFLFRRFFVKPAVAWVMLNLALVFMGLSITDQNFAAIVTKPDNVPIVGLVFILGFFTWLATYKAVLNDDRIDAGGVPLEKDDSEKVLVWPDLVYTELICMVLVTALLLVWAIGLQAPLEEPASSVKTPNPSKAPWYFMGLQEMLVYYDPWMAGVVLPSLIIVGLMAIPFIDFNKKGNDYYTIKERPFSYLMFQFGFLEMWVTLIILGTFLRGPNWNFFGPYEYWDPHKVLALNNVNLSEWFWVISLGKGLPKAGPDAAWWQQLGMILYRESPGILCLLFYFLALPPLMAVTIFRKFFIRMGFFRYMILANLLLFMTSLPLKMVLRWTVNLKYIVAIPEYFLNF